MPNALQTIFETYVLHMHASRETVHPRTDRGVRPRSAALYGFVPLSQGASTLQECSSSYMLNICRQGYPPPSMRSISPYAHKHSVCSSAACRNSWRLRPQRNDCTSGTCRLDCTMRDPCWYASGLLTAFYLCRLSRPSSLIKRKQHGVGLHRHTSRLRKQVSHANPKGKTDKPSPLSRPETRHMKC